MLSAFPAKKCTLGYKTLTGKSLGKIMPVRKVTIRPNVSCVLEERDALS